MSNIKALRPQDETLQTMLDRALEAHGDSKYCVIVVFDEAGQMDTYYYAAASELAMASVTLAQMAFYMSTAHLDS